MALKPKTAIAMQAAPAAMAYALCGCRPLGRILGGSVAARAAPRIGRSKRVELGGSSGGAHQRARALCDLIERVRTTRYGGGARAA